MEKLMKERSNNLPIVEIFKMRGKRKERRAEGRGEKGSIQEKRGNSKITSKERRWGWEEIVRELKDGFKEMMSKMKELREGREEIKRWMEKMRMG